MFQSAQFIGVTNIIVGPSLIQNVPMEQFGVFRAIACIGGSGAIHNGSTLAPTLGLPIPNRGDYPYVFLPGPAALNLASAGVTTTFVVLTGYSQGASLVTVV